MSDVVIEALDENRLDELLAFLTEWSPDHPELGEGDIVRWQKCDRFVALHDNRIVGYMAQIQHEFRYGKRSGREGVEPIGWAVTLVLDMSDDSIRKQSGRGLLTQCENNPPWQYSGVGMVPEVEAPYKRRGHAVRRDCSRMYTRLLSPAKALRYVGRSAVLAPAVVLANAAFRARRQTDQARLTRIDRFDPEWDPIWDGLLSADYELYGKRDADFLNYKLSQPNREYHAYTHADAAGRPDGYVIFRHASHRTRDLNLVKVCELVGTAQARLDLLPLAISLARDVKAYAIVAMGAHSDEGIYKQGGLYVSKPYPIAMSSKITARMHITFFDSDLDNLW